MNQLTRRLSDIQISNDKFERYQQTLYQMMVLNRQKYQTGELTEEQFTNALKAFEVLLTNYSIVRDMMNDPRR